MIPVVVTALVSATFAVGIGAPAAASVPAPAGTTPVRSCESLMAISLADTTIASSAVYPANGSTPETCRVHALVTHPPAHDEVNIDIWMPVANWNGRFEGTGGGGESGGSPANLPGPVQAGYAAGSTDAGHPGNSGSFALNPDGTLNWAAIRDFGYLGIHDMTEVGKALVSAYYGTAPRYAFFNGCSTGGRQGLMEAQRYPTDYDGILAGSPVVNYTQFHSMQLWGELVMLQADDFVPSCKFAAFQEAAVAACDALDGVSDGVIGDPRQCRFDPATLVGTVTPCGTITRTDADVVDQIIAGPRYQDGRFMWYGLPWGATFTGPGVNETAVVDGQLTGQPFFATLTWFTYWVAQDPAWDWRTLTFAEFDRLHDKEMAQFGDVIATDDPDLTAFRDAGGKLLMWHGYADWGVPPQGTINYYQRVEQVVGGGSAAKTQQFARLFMAPGVAHCGGGAGPQPTGQFEALVRWVEHHKAPRTLPAVKQDADGSVIETRPLCPFPAVARYKGHGDPNDAANFRCHKAYEVGRPHAGP